MDRREFLRLLSVATGAAAAGACAGRRAPSTEDLYQAPAFGNVRLLHITDTHAQLLLSLIHI